jgi:uncharacterized protein YndB with AHSA1/START domain
MTAIDTSTTIVQEITINAPAVRVFDALSNPQERVKWWGSKGRFQATHMESDLQPGGKWSMSGVRGESEPFVISGVYQEVERPKLLAFTWTSDWQKNIPATLVRWDLEEVDGVTTVRLTHSGFAGETDRDNFRGWPLLLAKLQGYVEGEADSVETA